MKRQSGAPDSTKLVTLFGTCRSRPGPLRRRVRRDPVSTARGERRRLHLDHRILFVVAVADHLEEVPCRPHDPLGSGALPLEGIASTARGASVPLTPTWSQRVTEAGKQFFHAPPLKSSTGRSRIYYGL
jgi:hypothetical protein